MMMDNYRQMEAVTEAIVPTCLCPRPPLQVSGPDVEACGDTDSRRMTQEFDSLFPLYLIVSEDDIYRIMTLKKRSHSLLFTQWATHLQSEQDHQFSGQPQSPPSPSIAEVQQAGRMEQGVRSHGRTNTTSPPHGNENTRIGEDVGLTLPTFPPHDKPAITPTIPFPGPVNFIVTVGSTPSTSQRHRRAKKKKDKTYFNELQFKL